MAGAEVGPIRAACNKSGLHRKLHSKTHTIYKHKHIRSRDCRTPVLGCSGLYDTHSVCHTRLSGIQPVVGNEKSKKVECKTKNYSDTRCAHVMGREVEHNGVQLATHDISASV